MAYAAAAGLILGAGGAFLGGRAGDIKRKRLEDVADLPGVDIGSATDEALSNSEKYMGRATSLSSDISAANQAQLLAREEAALPGIGAARGEALGRIRGLFSEDSEWLRGVQRRGAALGLSSGLFGSGAGQLQTLHLSDQEQMQRTQLGTGLLGSLIGSMRIANSPGAQAFLGPTASDTVAIRSQERLQRQNLLAQAAGIPGQTAAWGSYLSQTGGLIAGAGISKLMSGPGAFGGGGGGMPNSTQNAMMMSDYTGASNMGSSY